MLEKNYPENDVRKVKDLFKEVIMVWKIVYNSSSEEEGCLKCELISTKEPKGGLRPKMKRVSAKEQVTDLRHLAVDIFVYNVHAARCPEFVQNSGAAVHRLACSNIGKK